MDANYKWVVTINKSYYEISFEFDAFIDASCFICDAAVHGEEGTKVYIERIKEGEDETSDL
jgi:hypothetical protein